jgi:hypothetical protein
MLIELGGMVCGETMTKVSHRLLRENVQDQKRRGLSLINLRSQNIALLLKYLDKYFDKENIPWVNLIWNAYYANGELPQAAKKKGSFWWKDLQKLCDIFKGIAQCSIGNGTTVMFWSEVWNSNIMEQKIPRLCCYAKNKNISVASSIQNNYFEQQVHVPLSVQAFQEYQQMHDIIQQTQISSGAKDIWSYLWGTASYSASKFYHLPYKNVQPPRPFLWIWNFSCSNKVRVFSWLLLMDRLNGRNILRRKKHKLEGNNYNCVLCPNGREETTFYLFFHALSAKPAGAPLIFTGISTLTFIL